MHTLLKELQLKSVADAAPHHADSNTHLLSSGLAEQSRMGICDWSRFWVYGAVPHCQADIQVCSIFDMWLKGVTVLACTLLLDLSSACCLCLVNRRIVFAAGQHQASFYIKIRQ